MDYDDAGRGPLDPVLWLRTDVGGEQHIAEPDLYILHDAAPLILQTAVIAAKQRWRQTAKGHGHAAFFRLAKELERAGLEPEQITAQLIAEAQAAHSPRERLLEVAGIRKNLRCSFLNE